MGFTSVLGYAHKLAGERLRPGDCAVDATAGGGNDTAFLCTIVQPNGEVYAFDIQQAALEQTAGKLAQVAELRQLSVERRIHLVLADHAIMESHIPAKLHGRVGAVMFNLGYLPAGDQSVITRTTSTIPALEAALRLVRVGGVVTIVVYPGHPGGDEEAAAVASWAAQLSPIAFQALTYRFTNRGDAGAYLIAVEKL